jgi:hypothetical protein
VEGEFSSIPAGEQRSAQVDCPSGYHVVGGGIFSTEGETGEDINSSFPSQRGSTEFGNEGWAGWVDNTTAGTVGAQALAICAKAGKVSGP